MPIIVHTTCASQDEARAIARVAVEQKLCACAHIDEIESVYTWKDDVCSGAEWRIGFKTADDRFDALADLIRSMHSYDLPAIYATPVTQMTPDYALWVKENSVG